MTSVYNHLNWFIVLSSLFTLSLMCSLNISFQNESFLLCFRLFELYPVELSVSFYLDHMSSWFFSVVLFIATVVIVYSFFYISPYSNSNYFLWLTILFVLSMLIVISINNLFFILLGWDGLGLISFLLIVYYQNQTSLVSGYFTVLINRLGDGFFLVTIVLLSSSSSDLSVFSTFLPSSLSISILCLTLITNSALFPFSPWLPAAIAAPTPISALVHSSTLVTSGLFLIMRFSYLLYSETVVITLLIWASLFTSLYAGLNTIFENDLNKLIALSTLSHLGFIGIAFASSLLTLAFFHMLAHALFKSLLFISIGDIMINLNHSQEFRYLSNGSCLTPFSSYVIQVSILNLLGLPTLSGYFSNDLVLESLNYSLESYIFMLLVYLNVFLTYFYSYQLFCYTFNPSNLNPYQQFHSPLLLHSLSLFVLGLTSVTFGVFFITCILDSIIFLPVPSLVKFLPLSFETLIGFGLLVFLNLFFSNNPFLNSFLSSMIYLSPTTLSVSSSLYFNVSSSIFKLLEAGSLSFAFNNSSSSFVLSSAQFLLLQSFVHPLMMLGFSIFLFAFLIL